MLTEEINLDEEIKKQETAQQPRPKSRVKQKSQLKFPTQSPFELSDSDLNAPTELGEKRPSSSDFELTPQGAKDDSSGSVVIEPSSSDDFSLELPDDSGVECEDRWLRPEDPRERGDLPVETVGAAHQQAPIAERHRERALFVAVQQADGQRVARLVREHGREQVSA